MRTPVMTLLLFSTLLRCSLSPAGGALGSYKGAPGQLWVDMGTGDLVVFDTATGKQLKTVPAPTRDTGGIAYVSGTIWVAEGAPPHQVVGIDVATGAATTPFDHNPGAGAPAVAAGKAWITSIDEVSMSEALCALTPAAQVTFQPALASVEPATELGGSDDGVFLLGQDSLIQGPVQLVHVNAADNAELGRVSLAGLPGVPDRLPIIASVAAIPGRVFVLVPPQTSPSDPHGIIAVDSAAHTVLANVALPADTTPTRLLLDGKRLYAADTSGNTTLLELDTTSLAVLRKIDYSVPNRSVLAAQIIGGGAAWAGGTALGQAFVRRIDLGDGSLSEIAIAPSAGTSAPNTLAFVPP